MSAGVRRSRLLWRDVVALGTTGLRARPARAILSALGIAIGIAAMVAVVGMSTSGQARLNAQLAALGTNLLTVTAGQNLMGANTALPRNAVPMVSRIDGVDLVSSTSLLKNLSVYRSSVIDPGNSGGMTVLATRTDLLRVVGGTVRVGNWFTSATAGYPTVVLGAKSAQRLGVVSPGTLVWLGGQYFSVIGILDPVVLAPELDSSVLIGESVAKSLFDFDGKPSTIYERSPDAEVQRVRSLLPATVNPEDPTGVTVGRPSDALAAKNATDQAFTGLLVGLGSIALLVGGIGVANTMVISVLERRREIGLRRALGAARMHIGTQFLAEALLLSLGGGILGVGLGVGVTAVIALVNGWPVAVPAIVLVAGVGATLVIGANAGLYPAIRAARTLPTTALAA